ncbi:transcriptional regulator [Caldicellulosiruptor hydrothermalis]|nr:transcriptional regulator [Caldicellulosiruptor hydrothermalis]
MLDSNIYRAIEKILYHYFDIKHEIKAKEEEIMNCQKYGFKIDLGNAGYYSDPTATMAIKLCSKELEIMRKWIQVIDAAKEKFKGTGKGRLLEMRYFEELATDYICQKLFIERRTFYHWRDDIVVYIASLAVKYELYDPEKERIKIPAFLNTKSLKKCGTNKAIKS